MSTVTVTSSAGLESALKVAQAGDTILLAAGNYSNVFIQNFACAGNVTIASADPSHKAVLSDLNVMNSSGLTFSGLEFSSDVSKFPGLPSSIATDPYPFRVSNSDRITFSGDDFHGSLDQNPGNDRSGLMFSASKNISVINSEFHELEFGIVHSMSNYVTISNNSFHDIRSDGIHGSSSFATVSNNYFTNFYPATGDHPDAIQFFDENNGTAPHDLVISGNVYVRGAGAAIEGIFLRLLDGSPLKFVNVQITDNLLEGTNYHGITVLGGKNVTIANNTAYGLGDYTSRIWIGNSDTVVESNNKASVFIYGSSASTSSSPTDSNTNITVSGSVVTSALTDGGKAVFDQWLAAHPGFTAYQIGSTTGTTQPPPATTTPPPVTTTPPPPSDLVLDGSTDTGVQGDGWTKMAVVKIDGVAESGSSVMVYDAGTLVATSEAGAGGSFSIASLHLGQGSHALTAVSKSASGVLSAASAALNVVVDTVASAVDVSDFSIGRASKNASSVTVSGTAVDDSNCAVSIDIVRDGTLIKTISTNSGAWAFTDSAGNGVHTYVMQGTDIAGNVAVAAHSLVIGAGAGETICGASGADYISGGGGYDAMSGGGGNDVFVFAAGDAPMMATSRNGKRVNIETITDFSTGDKLDLSDLGHLTFAGQTQTLGAHQVEWYVAGGNTFVVADASGDGKADFMVQLSGVHALTSADFMFA
jgi:hypothetical protein